MTQHHPTEPEIRLISVGRLDHGFTQVTNALILGPGAARLSDPAFRLAVIALARLGELGTPTAELSYSFLRVCTNASDDRIQRMKRNLCAGLPHVFSVIPGDKTSGIGDGIRVDLSALTTEHVDYLNWRETGRAQRQQRPIQTRYAVKGNPIPTSGVPLPLPSGDPLPGTPGAPSPEVGEKEDTQDIKTPKTVGTAGAASPPPNHGRQDEQSLRHLDELCQQVGRTYNQHRGPLPRKRERRQDGRIIIPAQTRNLIAQLLKQEGDEASLIAAVVAATVAAASEARREPDGWMQRTGNLHHVLKQLDDLADKGLQNVRDVADTPAGSTQSGSPSTVGYRAPRSI